MSANGYLRDDELAPIDNGQRLRPDAATRYNALRAHAQRDGYRIATTEGYRDYATQVFLWNLYGSPRASYPGFSPHGLGLAVDINTTGWGGTAVYDWMSWNAGAYGFNNNVGRQIDEHWHWVYDGSGSAGHEGVPFPVDVEEEDDMYGIEVASDGNKNWPVGSRLVGSGNGPLRASFDLGPEQQVVKSWAPWTAALVERKIDEVGILGRGPDLGKVFDSKGNVKYTLGGGSTVVNGSDNAALLAAVERLTAAVVANKPPAGYTAVR